MLCILYLRWNATWCSLQPLHIFVKKHPLIALLVRFLQFWKCRTSMFDLKRPHEGTTLSFAEFLQIKPEICAWRNLRKKVMRWAIQSLLAFSGHTMDDNRLEGGGGFGRLRVTDIPIRYPLPFCNLPLIQSTSPCLMGWLPTSISKQVAGEKTSIGLPHECTGCHECHLYWKFRLGSAKWVLWRAWSPG